MRDNSSYDYTKHILDSYLSYKDEEIIYGDVLWNYLSCQWRYRLPEDFILRFKDYLNFRELTTRRDFSSELLNNLVLRPYWAVYKYSILINSRIIPDFIVDSYKDSDNSHVRYAINNKIPLDKLEQLILENRRCVDWEILSERDNLTKEFVEKYLGNFHIEYLLEYSNVRKLYKREKDFIEKLEMLKELSN